jgi:fatty acid desaturase
MPDPTNHSQLVAVADLVELEAVSTPRPEVVRAPIAQREIEDFGSWNARRSRRALLAQSVQGLLVALATVAVALLVIGPRASMTQNEWIETVLVASMWIVLLTYVTAVLFSRKTDRTALAREIERALARRTAGEQPPEPSG